MLRGLVLWAILVAATFPLVTRIAVAASYERCILGYRIIKSPAYNQRLQRDGAACNGYENKYTDDPNDTIMSDPCYGGPPICREQLGLDATRTECGEVASSKLGTPDQIAEAERIFLELRENMICPYAQ